MTFWGNKYMLFIKAQRTTGVCLESQCDCPAFKSKNSKKTLHHMYTLSNSLHWWVQHRPLECYLEKYLSCEKMSLFCESARRGTWDVHNIWPRELLPGRCKTLVLGADKGNTSLSFSKQKSSTGAISCTSISQSEIPRWPSKSNNFFLRSRLFSLLSINFAF